MHAKIAISGWKGFYFLVSCQNVKGELCDFKTRNNTIFFLQMKIWIHKTIKHNFSIQNIRYYCETDIAESVCWLYDSPRLGR